MIRQQLSFDIIRQLDPFLSPPCFPQLIWPRCFIVFDIWKGGDAIKSRVKSSKKTRMVMWRSEKMHLPLTDWQRVSFVLKYISNSHSTYPPPLPLMQQDDGPPFVLLLPLIYYIHTYGPSPSYVSPFSQGCIRVFSLHLALYHGIFIKRERILNPLW